jgi:hypothetical protein
MPQLALPTRKRPAIPATEAVPETEFKEVRCRRLVFEKSDYGNTVIKVTATARYCSSDQKRDGDPAWDVPIAEEMNLLTASEFPGLVEAFVTIDAWLKAKTLEKIGEPQ